MSVFPQSLWDFSLSLYGHSPMEALCLQLQDQQHININQLLWALWLDEQQRPFCEQLWQQGLSHTAFWHRWRVVPLRKLRRALPKRRPWLGLRNQVKRWELRGERRELECLQAVSDEFEEVRRISGNDNREARAERYIFQLVDAEGESYRQLQQILNSWRLQRVKTSQ